MARLQSLGVEVVTPTCCHAKSRQQSKHVRQLLTYSDEALRAGYYFYDMVWMGRSTLRP